ncbi:MAG: hypothetical protein AMS27_07005 [Bacteroides sp. SM23_62_1]|nr:MAG: hypothetical protein AMS27_07005 [Bacteroides sp. SM23_62_1]
MVINCCTETGLEPEPTTSEKLQKVLDNNLEEFNGKGVSAAVIFQNQDLWSGTSGISFGTSSITKDMIFNIGSVTKTFIAALCLQLADKGAICLEDSLHKWLPDYPNIDNSTTILQLLTNTSGINNITDNPELWSAVFDDPAKLWTLKELVSSFLDEPYAAPGEDWFYSNTNYILLGEIIKVATGSSVSSGLRNHFFEPLGISNTYYAIEETLPPDIAHGWFDLTGNGSYDDVSLISRNGIYSVLGSSAAIFSTAEDLAKWSSALFNGNVLSESSLDMMLYAYSTMPGTTDVGCGMGVFLIGPANNTGVKLIGYTGRTFGYLTSMFYLPDYDISVAVIINEDNTACLDAITTDLILEALNNG